MEDEELEEEEEGINPVSRSPGCRTTRLVKQEYLKPCQRDRRSNYPFNEIMSLSFWNSCPPVQLLQRCQEVLWGQPAFLSVTLFHNRDDLGSLIRGADWTPPTPRSCLRCRRRRRGVFASQTSLTAE